MADCYLGEIRMFGGAFAPVHWALCNGQTLQISDNQNLFSLIGTTYGGNGTTTFCVPDLRGRLPIGQGQGAGLSSRTLGQSVGADAVPLTESQIPPHTHSLTVSSDPATSLSPAGCYYAAPTASGTVTGMYLDLTTSMTTATLFAGAMGHVGYGSAHYNVMPCQVINYIIALNGDYPVRS